MRSVCSFPGEPCVPIWQPPGSRGPPPRARAGRAARPRYWGQGWLGSLFFVSALPRRSAAHEAVRGPYFGAYASFALPSRVEVRRIEVVFPGDAYQREQRVAAGVGQGGPHPMRGRGIGQPAHRPIGRRTNPGRRIGRRMVVLTSVYFPRFSRSKAVAENIGSCARVPARARSSAAIRAWIWPAPGRAGAAADRRLAAA
jgi:hypothetical protein